MSGDVSLGSMSLQLTAEDAAFVKQLSHAQRETESFAKRITDHVRGIRIGESLRRAANEARELARAYTQVSAASGEAERQAAIKEALGSLNAETSLIVSGLGSLYDGIARAQGKAESGILKTVEATRIGAYRISTWSVVAADFMIKGWERARFEIARGLAYLQQVGKTAWVDALGGEKVVKVLTLANPALGALLKLTDNGSKTWDDYYKKVDKEAKESAEVQKALDADISKAFAADLPDAAKTAAKEVEKTHRETLEHVRHATEAGITSLHRFSLAGLAVALPKKTPAPGEDAAQAALTITGATARFDRHQRTATDMPSTEQDAQVALARTRLGHRANAAARAQVTEEFHAEIEKGIAGPLDNGKGGAASTARLESLLEQGNELLRRMGSRWSW